MSSVAALRELVMKRDRYFCQAWAIDPEAGVCHDRDGWAWTTSPYDLEMDYVRRGAHGARHELPEDHVTLCPGHHRGTGQQAGYVWATAHRAEMRAWLEQQDRT